MLGNGPHSGNHVAGRCDNQAMSTRVERKPDIGPGGAADHVSGYGRAASPGIGFEDRDVDVPGTTVLTQVVEHAVAEDRGAVAILDRAGNAIPGARGLPAPEVFDEVAADRGPEHAPGHDAVTRVVVKMVAGYIPSSCVVHGHGR